MEAVTDAVQGAEVNAPENAVPAVEMTEKEKQRLADLADISEEQPEPQQEEKKEPGKEGEPEPEILEPDPDVKIPEEGKEAKEEEAPPEPEKKEEPQAPKPDKSNDDLKAEIAELRQLVKDLADRKPTEESAKPQESERKPFEMSDDDYDAIFQDKAKFQSMVEQIRTDAVTAATEKAVSEAVDKATDNASKAIYNWLVAPPKDGQGGGWLLDFIGKSVAQQVETSVFLSLNDDLDGHVESVMTEVNAIFKEKPDLTIKQALSVAAEKVRKEKGLSKSTRPRATDGRFAQPTRTGTPRMGEKKIDQRTQDLLDIRE